MRPDYPTSFGSTGSGERLSFALTRVRRSGDMLETLTYRLPPPNVLCQLLIDWEENQTLRAVLVGMLRESEGR
jgi:hypothetical protein